MKNFILLFVVIMLLVMANVVLADDLVIYESEWQDETTQGYHYINEDGMKQEVFYNDDSITTQAELLEMVFTELYGEPERDRIEETIILRWVKDSKEIFLKREDDYFIVHISDIAKEVP